MENETFAAEMKKQHTQLAKKEARGETPVETEDIIKALHALKGRKVWIQRPGGDWQEVQVAHIDDSSLTVDVAWQDPKRPRGIGARSVSGVDLLNWQALKSQADAFVRLRPEIESLIGQRVWIQRRDGTWQSATVSELGSDNRAKVVWEDKSGRHSKKVPFAVLLAWQKEVPRV